MKSVLVTGGTGSFGKAFLAQLLKSNPCVERLVIYSRDELKQWGAHGFQAQDKQICIFQRLSMNCEANL